MPDHLGVFLAASVAFVVVPGPAVAYIVTRSVTQGRAAGVVSALGVQVGGLVHVAAAAVGLSALLASSATLFTAVKVAGAAYLVWLGVQKLLRPHGLEPGSAPPADRARLFRQGVLVNVLNPKTGMFFLAFLPQFVDPEAGSAALQVLLLGLLFVTVATLSDSTYALIAGVAAHRLRRSATARRRLDRPSGGVLVALGGAAALLGERPARA
ncbi:MAG TPA: LysE family translocator [Baekduia sp.]|nr:LysE family translocator [Baekduia sp.]